MADETVEDGIRARLRRPQQSLWRRYLVSMVVSVLLLSGVLAINRIGSAQVGDSAALVNIAGRERMISQRILLLSLTPETLTRREIGQLADEFERALDRLAREGGEHVRTALASRDGQGPTSEAVIRHFLGDARRFSAGGRLALSDWSGSAILAPLERLTSAAEAETRDAAMVVAQVELAAFAVVLAMILAQTVLVYRPGQRALSSAIEALIRRNISLRHAGKALESRSIALAEAHRQMAADARNLRQALSEAELLRREQADFTYAVSHDLKSPANTMGLLVDELRADSESRLSSASCELLDMAAATAARMRALVDSVLDYSHATRPGSPDELVPFAEIVAEVLTDMRFDIARRGASVTVDPALPPVIGDPVQLRLMVQNLINNALKFTPADRPPEILVQGRLTDGGVAFSFTDNGIGIDAADHERIFGLFQRLHLRDEYPGAGVGLALCRRIAANHNGAITVRSQPGAGTTFDVTFSRKAA